MLGLKAGDRVKVRLSVRECLLKEFLALKVVKGRVTEVAWNGDVTAIVEGGAFLFPHYLPVAFTEDGKKRYTLLGKEEG